MKKIIILSLCFSVFNFTFCLAQKKKNKTKEKTATEVKTAIQLKTVIDSVSYIIGTNIAQNFSKDFPEINLDHFLVGLNDKMDPTKEVMFKDEEGQKILQKFFMEKQQLQSDTEKEKLAPLIKQGEEFLANNRRLFYWV